MFIPPQSISQLTQSHIHPLLMFWGWCIRPPFNQNKFCRMRHNQFPVRCVLKPIRILLIRIPTVGTTPVAHSLYLLHRARVMICGFPIPTNRTTDFHPHDKYPTFMVIKNDGMPSHDCTIMEPQYQHNKKYLYY